MSTFKTHGHVWDYRSRTMFQNAQCKIMSFTLHYLHVKGKFHCYLKGDGGNSSFPLSSYLLVSFPYTGDENK